MLSTHVGWLQAPLAVASGNIIPSGLHEAPTHTPHLFLSHTHTHTHTHIHTDIHRDTKICVLYVAKPTPQSENYNQKQKNLPGPRLDYLPSCNE